MGELFEKYHSAESSFEVESEYLTKGAINSFKDSYIRGYVAGYDAAKEKWKLEIKEGKEEITQLDRFRNLPVDDLIEYLVRPSCSECKLYTFCYRNQPGNCRIAWRMWFESEAIIL